MMTALERRERQLQRTREAIARGRPAETPASRMPALPTERRRVYQTGPLVEPEVDARTPAEVAAASEETGICVRCGRSHAPENRQRLIRPMRGMVPSEIAAAWPCFYPNFRKGGAAEAMIWRDLTALRGGR